MDADEGNGEKITSKRQRTPLSDSEDNVLSPGKDGQKRRRLESAGRENHSPKPSSSGRQIELQTKPDTPMVPSVRSRVQLLTQKRGGGAPLAQRFLSDPGANSPGFGEQCLGVGEFHQRMERFQVPIFQASPALAKSPISVSVGASSLVSGIQQKLQANKTSSSQQESRIREERRLELSKLQPISENAWLKRSNSDPALTQAENDVKIKDGSFIKDITSGAEKKSAYETDAILTCEAAASAEHDSGNGVQLQKECKEGNAPPAQAAWGEMESKAGFGDSGSQPLQSQAMPNVSSSEHERPSGTEDASVEPTCLRESEVSITVEESQEHLCVTETKVDVPSFTGEKGVNLPDANLPEAKSSETYLVRSCNVQEDQHKRPELLGLESDSGLNSPVKEQCHLNADHGSRESCEGCSEGPQTGNPDVVPLKVSQKDVDACTYEKEICQETTEGVMVDPRWTDPQLEKNRLCSIKERQNEDSELKANVCKQKVKTQTGMEQETKEKTERGESSRTGTFLPEPDVISDLTQSENSASVESLTKTGMSEMSLNDETDTAEMIDQMFEEVLEYAGRLEEENKDCTEDHDGGIGASAVDGGRMDTESEKEKHEQECETAKKSEDTEDELLTFPPSGILSPLSKSVEAVVTPLRLKVSQESNPPSLLLTPAPAESAPLYSVDAYRTQRQTKTAPLQCVTPDVQRKVWQRSQPQASVSSKERIAALNEEAAKLQTVINQTLQALSCCTDQDHGRGSLEEAEAEKLLLVSCEKRAALLAEISRLREERCSESGEDCGSELDCVSQQPCRGTVDITNIRLPLKLEFVCSSHNRPGQPSHYFFILIRYGPCNMVATPLATAADAQNGDTISFPTSVTLKDIRSSFEIDVEVYSLSHASASCAVDRTVTKSRITPRKLLNTITRSSNGLAPAAPPPLTSRRSSSFSLVGSHQITLASLGLNKFPLDKMKLEGKVRRLLGDEFQEKILSHPGHSYPSVDLFVQLDLFKFTVTNSVNDPVDDSQVPFLSPLEGHIYLQLDSRSHSAVHHQGFLTMFELISGYGVWNRRYFVLKGCALSYWNHPNDRETKEAAGSISQLISYQSVRAVQRDLCARPFTFELVSSLPQQKEDSGDSVLAKCWFSADTKQERLDWMERLSQVLLDFQTWNGPAAAAAAAAATGAGESKARETLRESIL